MANQMLIRIDRDVKDKFERIARNEGKNMTQKIRELIEDYVNDNDISSYVDELWDRIGKKLDRKKVTPGDINRAIRKARSSR
ncbi:MAG TPA: ribbon-helix-helix protein, CopG family [Spirochaetota bacterium]|nr:ribbon-helix-helix protein, CopG family [Spirochaetota bacterium]HRZ26008.1 ribbon-helix-helix protein, CopG family [Spirochaetota bacterium]